MGRFDEKYSADQKAALYELTLEQGLNVKKAVEKLAGQNEVRFNYGTAKQLVRKERQRRNGLVGSPLAQAKPDHVREALIRRCYSILDLRTAQAMSELRDGKEPSDPDVVRKTAVALRELRAFEAQAAAPSQTATPGRPRALDRLLAAHKQDPTADNGSTPAHG